MTTNQRTTFSSLENKNIMNLIGPRTRLVKRIDRHKDRSEWPCYNGYLRIKNNHANNTLVALVRAKLRDFYFPAGAAQTVACILNVRSPGRWRERVATSAITVIISWTAIAEQADTLDARCRLIRANTYRT